MGRLDGTVAYITGGASGLGRALVARFIGEGARVGVLDLSDAGCAALRAEFGDALVATVGDVRDYAWHAGAVELTLAQFGRIDTYIGNAAIWDGNVSLVNLPGERIGDAFDEVFGINVKGYLLGAKAAADALIASEGNIIFTLSMAALHASGGGPIYTASKHAGIGLVRELAYELAPQVRVNGVAPAAMATDLRGPRALDLNTPQMANVDQALMRSGYPLNFFPTPEDYVGPYVFLASKTEAATVTGIVVESDLGLSARGVRKPFLNAVK
jgi:2,3-dihydroxy-2,3-dihydrophenylpropionate dehydrogenase